MGKNNIGVLASLMVLSVMTGMKNSIYDYTSGWHWDDKSFDMKSINKAKKNNRKKKRRK